MNDAGLLVLSLQRLDLLVDLLGLGALVAVEQVVGGEVKQPGQQQQHAHLVIPGHAREEVARLFCWFDYGLC